MKLQPKVNVLVATYNGDKFIKRQLQSIAEQSYENISVYIRDDGSSDRTVEVIEEFILSNTSKKEFKMIDYGGANLKCPKSFFEIARQCDAADYYAWCDQDDVWYPDKIKWAVEKLEQENAEDILVYSSAFEYKDEFGKLIRKSPEQLVPIKLYHTLYYTPGLGFTMIFNETARQELLLNVNLGDELHDRWMLRGGAALGKVIYDTRVTAAHIRHSEAVTAGDSTNCNLIRYVIKNEILGQAIKKDKDYLYYFYKTFENELSSGDKVTLELFSSPNSLIKQLKKIFYSKRMRPRLSGEIVLRFYFLIGRL